MALHIPDFVRVWIDGTERTDYVIAYHRESSICAMADTFAIELDFNIPVVPDPYDLVIIRELYDGDNEKVIGGYAIDVVQQHSPGSYLVNGQDKTLLLEDFFIHTQTISNGETAAYWINWYAGKVGLSVQYDSSVSQFIVEEGSPMGMQTAMDGLSMLERLAAVYIKYDAVLDKLRVFRTGDSEPVIHLTNSQTTSFERMRGTEKTRNVVNVHGGYRHNIFTGETSQVFATARTEIPELTNDKTVVLANPLIKRTTVAQIVASRILEVVDELDDLIHITTHGFYPEVAVGEYASISMGSADHTYSGEREITSIQTQVDNAGAVTIFTVGEKCPRISIVPPISIVYATAENGGILISYDGGDTFAPFNRGIVSTTSEIASGINGRSIAANRFSQLMSIADDKLYKRVGKYGSWSELTNLGDPSNDEGMYPQVYADLKLVKVEKEAGYYGKFHVLAKLDTIGYRWWVYWTKNFGTTWESMQLYVPGSGVPVGTPSGLPMALVNGAGITQAELQTAATLSGAVRWSVATRDIEGSKNNNVTVATATSYGDDWRPVAQDWISDYYLLDTDLDRNDPRVWASSGTGFGDSMVWDSKTPQYLTSNGDDCDPFVKRSLWAPPRQELVDGIRKVCYVVTTNSVDEKYHIWRTIDGGNNWIDIHSSKTMYDSTAENPSGPNIPPTIIHWEGSLEGHNIAKFGVVHYYNYGTGAAQGCDSETPCGYTCHYYTEAQLSGVVNTVTVDLWEDDITYSGGGGCSSSDASHTYSIIDMGRTYFQSIGSSRSAQIGNKSYVSISRKEFAIPIDCESPQTMVGNDLSLFDVMTIDWLDMDSEVHASFETSEWHPSGDDNEGNVNTTQLTENITVLTDVYYAVGVPQAGEPYHATVRWYADGDEITSQEYDPDELGSIYYLEKFNSGQLDTHFLGFKTYAGSNVIGYQAGYPHARSQLPGWSARGRWISAGLSTEEEFPIGRIPAEYAGWHFSEGKRYGSEITSYEGHPVYGPYVMRGDGHIYGFQWEDIPGSGWFFVGNAPTRSTLLTATCEMQIRRFPTEMPQTSSPPDPSGYAPCHVFHTNDTWGTHRILWSGMYLASGFSLFGDAYSHSLVGAHFSGISGYASFGGLVTLTRLDTTVGLLGVAGSASGIPYTITGPTTFRQGGKIANYLSEFSTAMGVSYIETAPTSGTIFSFAGDIHWNANYPPIVTSWATVSGIGEPQNDIVGLDYPDNPRVLVSSPNITNVSGGGGGVGVMVINVASGAAQEHRYATYFYSDVAKNIYITDLEAQRILG